MAYKRLTESQKYRLHNYYTVHKWTQQEIADYFNIHRKTVYNVLLAAGALEPRQSCTAREAALLTLLKQYRVTPQQLEEMLQSRTNRSKQRAV